MLVSKASGKHMLATLVREVGDTSFSVLITGSLAVRKLFLSSMSEVRWGYDLQRREEREVSGENGGQSRGH